MNPIAGQHGAALGPWQQTLWCLYLLAAVMLPLSHVRPIVRYLRGTRGIGDACIRTEAIQCLWRVPALMFAIWVAPSLPLFLSIFLDLMGRIGRVVAMRISQRRWHTARHDATGGSRSSTGPNPAYKPGLESDTPFR